MTAQPKLLVFGESLGSHAAEAAFAGFDSFTSMANLVARTEGALFAGPVASNPIWSTIVNERVLDHRRGVPISTMAARFGCLPASTI